MKQFLWTKDGGRLKTQSSYTNDELNWLFLPGGPGLGSEELQGLTELPKDKLPGTISGAWHYPWFESPDEVVAAFKEFRPHLTP